MANDINKFDTIADLKDVQRPYLFELVIANPIGVAGMSEDEVTLRCHKASIPGRGAEIIETNFYGLKLHYAGRPTYGTYQLNVEFTEHEDQRLIKFLHDWNNLVYNTRTGNGGSEKSYKTDITLNMYKNDRSKLPYYIQFRNCFIESIADSDVVHAAASEGVKYSVTFRFDYWELGG
jgi:hypothetical protein